MSDTPARSAPSAGPMPGALGRAMERVYRAVVARRNRRYDAARRVRRLPIPVISVGNLSVGGTGKTPMARWIVRTLRDAGLRPALALRGYRAKAGVSDEASEHQRLLPDLPIAMGADRFDAISRLLESTGVNAVVLDDGFQHRRLHRDLDIVLLDATRDPFADRCLPAGWLREPVASLARAREIVLTHTESVAPAALDALRRAAAAVAPRASIALAAHAWTGLEGVPGQDAAPVEWLSGRRVIALCAIGNPRAFLDQAGRAGALVVHADARRDHARYNRADIERLDTLARRERAEAILTTAKDWSKLEPLVGRDAPFLFVRPRLEIVFPDGSEALRALVLQAARAEARCFSDAPAPADSRAGVLRS